MVIPKVTQIIHIILFSQTRRCFLSAGFSASSPMKSRVVEALCLLLCEKFPQSHREVRAGKPSTTSRWKLILSEYNSAIRTRLLKPGLVGGNQLDAVCQRPRERKEYSCRVCGRPMTTPGHSQFYGQRYCPDAPGQLPQEWLRMKKQVRDRKKQKGPDPQ